MADKDDKVEEAVTGTAMGDEVSDLVPFVDQEGAADNIDTASRTTGHARGKTVTPRPDSGGLGRTHRPPHSISTRTRYGRDLRVSTPRRFRLPSDANGEPPSGNSRT
ncbi:hypothetical protein [Streptomyces rimosus]|uniref:hypothetical protein n=1 Tax=Streptomyces rimosus TaxID=1927 RepID=UPI00131A9475|nr:hypothetical protein [Streptomyces rimosus]